MANHMRAIHPMPMFVIDTCLSEDEQELIQTTISLKWNTFPRSLSLLNYGEIYKDLSGTLHYSSFNRLKNSFLRSHSCPDHSLSNEKSSSTTGNDDAMHLLDPYNDTRSAAGSSSRYSLYESFLDLSERNYQPSLVKTDNKLLTIDGRPLFIVDNSSKLSTNTYQDKCKDWLSHLNLM